MSGSHNGRKKPKTAPIDDHLDLVPLIDCVFLLLLFFMLVGRLTNDIRTDQVTVPPTRTAAALSKEMQRVVINVFGSTRNAGGENVPRNSIGLVINSGQVTTWKSEGKDNFTGYKALRAEMDKVWDRADKEEDHKTKMPLPKVVVEIRADCDTEYRVVQEIQMILTDSAIIDDKEGLKPQSADKKPLKAFVNIDFTTRPTGN